MTRHACTRLALLLALMGTPAAFAAGEGATYRAALDAASEVPATQSKGTGEVTATFDPATKRLSWKGSYSNLTGPVTAAHFHGPAKPGENAGVLVPVTASASPFTGEATLDRSIELYERGNQLRARCAERLDRAQARIEAIRLDADGRPAGTEPFAAG